MIWLFIASRMANDVVDVDDKDKHAQTLLKRAIEFVNKTAGLNLTFNYPMRAHQTINSYTDHVDLGDGMIMDQLNDTVICISDSDDELDDVRANDGQHVNVISNRIDVQDIDHQMHTSSFDCCCCTDYNTLFKKYFECTKFRLCSDIQCATIACLVCSQMVERDALNAHLGKCTKFCG